MKNPTTLNADVFTVNADGSSKENLTRSAEENDRRPAWSPTGARIAFDRGGNWKMRADGTNEVRVTFDGADAAPSWQPLP